MLFVNEAPVLSLGTTGLGEPIQVSLLGATAATVGNYGTFFIADRSYTVSLIQEIHTTAGSDGGAVTLTVEKLRGVQAPGAGKDLLAATKFNLKATANTLQSFSGSGLSATPSDLAVIAGDVLALKLTGTPTSLANVTVGVQLIMA